MSISGNFHSTPIINLNSADNVNIDGRVNQMGSTVSLPNSNLTTLSNVGISTIRFINDDTNKTVRYYYLKGSSKNGTGDIAFFSTTSVTGNCNSIIENNNSVLHLKA